MGVTALAEVNGCPNAIAASHLRCPLPASSSLARVELRLSLPSSAGGLGPWVKRREEAIAQGAPPKDMEAVSRGGGGAV